MTWALKFSSTKKLRQFERKDKKKKVPSMSSTFFYRWQIMHFDIRFVNISWIKEEKLLKNFLFCCNFSVARAEIIKRKTPTQKNFPSFISIFSGCRCNYQKTNSEFKSQNSLVHSARKMKADETKNRGKNSEKISPVCPI